MGLDITFHTGTVLLPEHPRTDKCFDEHLFVFAYAGFERSYDGLAQPTTPVVLGDRTPVTGGRCYATGPGDWYGKVHANRSYSGYGDFRNQLALATTGIPAREFWAHPDAHVDDPFYELINFADNEGCIGPVAALELAGDFIAYRNAFTAAAEDPWDVEFYDQLAAGFALAAEPGFIAYFH